MENLFFFDNVAKYRYGYENPANVESFTEKLRKVIAEAINENLI